MMKAGRELDALVAEKVFGLKVDYEFDEPFAPALRDRYDEYGLVPHYSTSIEAAWDIIEHMRDQWTAATEGVDGFSDFDRPFDDGAFFDILHRNADRRWPWAFLYVTPHAICIAALRAVGVEL